MVFRYRDRQASISKAKKPKSSPILPQVWLRVWYRESLVIESLCVEIFPEVAARDIQRLDPEALTGRIMDF